MHFARRFNCAEKATKKGCPLFRWNGRYGLLNSYYKKKGASETKRLEKKVISIQLVPILCSTGLILQSGHNRLPGVMDFKKKGRESFQDYDHK